MRRITEDEVFMPRKGACRFEVTRQNRRKQKAKVLQIKNDENNDELLPLPLSHKVSSCAIVPVHVPPSLALPSVIARGGGVGLAVRYHRPKDLALSYRKSGRVLIQ